MITVALDKTADDARPWIESVNPTHPTLIDPQHLMADLYNVVNVPTIFWIDERGRIVRPNDVAFGSDTFKHITGLSAGKHLDALRAWVKGEAPALSDEQVRQHQPLPTEAEQQARAEPLFVGGGVVAPHDFTIRRGTMPMRGIDSMGPQFREMLQTWVGAGQPFYRPLPDTAGR